MKIGMKNGRDTKLETVLRAIINLMVAGRTSK
jgi:hypothetical protein